ncbi:PREDICTED: regulator of G-protein signaling 22 [Chaetura pelagica]|uniref:regulator of G-protein signaling 22 n=1 Tax=Chaetura pelagica TaxID=8897 RepID=UPI000523DD56|nr:PREDICTED: regulator of G-protein signaling 22 [Chaetura pelagica]
MGTVVILSAVEEEYLDTDDMLVEYFNEFLSLPTFAQPVKFNPEFRVFEVVNDAPQLLENQLKKILRDQTPPKPIYDVLRRAKNDGQLSKMRSTSPALNIDPNYNTMCLDRAQAIQWIKKERLPAFLESDCYFEYRLAKLVSQVEWSKTGINFIIDSDFYPWIKKRDPSSPSPEEDDTSLMMKPGQATVSQTEDLSTLAKQGELMNTTDSSMHPVASSQIQDTQCLPGQHERDDSLSKEDTLLGKPASAKASIKREISREADEASYVAIAEPPSHTQLRVYLDPKWDSIEKEEDELGSAAFQTLEEFVPASTQFVTKEPISELTHQPAADIESDVDLQKHELANNEFVSDSKGDVKKKDPEEISLSSSSESDGADIRAAWCISHGTYDTGNRREFERFKKFIKGTLGERYWWLWMDIERLKTLQVTTRQQRQLSKMKKLYLLSSGDYFLSSEVLLRLDLQHGDQWNTKHLRRIQPEVVKPLLLYWGPRFCVTHSTAIDTASAKLKFWHTCQQRPKVDVDPFPQMVSLLPLTPKSGIPRIQPSLSQGKSAAGSVVLGESRMESMLQSLYLENRAGYYFTHFCEKSGNKLWKNSVYFWFDLQAYHQLFYQETLHPFKICKQAQYLYATYIAPSASMDIGLDQSKKNMIYQKIDPAFEDLFDPAEEYILTVLLEPWMKMMEADKYTYGKVELVEETRQLDSVYFRKLQALHQESGSKKDESTAADTGLPSHLGALKEDQRFSQVPKELAGPDLSDLIHDKEMLEQFWAFLNEHSAGMDLMCWLDIEQLRKMLHKDKEKMEEKSKDIGNKYFNKNYFFGPNSPATREQQEQLMRSGGGGGQILHDQLSAAVLLEMQRCVQKRLEKQWLPLFLAEEQHREEGEKKVKDITEDLPHQKQDKTTRMWKHVDSKWVSSSSEIITFRKALLNPVTANQFQRFVSLKGDLLVNGVLFWQEVQKYKDLCHSHCDDATVQKKITAIIDRFIRSAVPPALQIDIPTEQAKKILEHRKELGPYIFREAQMTIFALLFKFWPKYCEFQSSLDSDKVLSALERKRMQKKEGKTAQGKEKAPTSQKTSPEAKLADLSSSALGDQTGLEWKGKAPLGGYGWQASWCYSKYIEALEQERILLKREEDLEKSSSSSLTGTSSTPFPKLENSKQSTMSSKSSVILEKRSNLPKK